MPSRARSVLGDSGLTILSSGHTILPARVISTWALSRARHRWMRLIFNRNAVLPTGVKAGRTACLFRESVLGVRAPERHNKRTDKSQQKESHHDLFERAPSNPKGGGGIPNSMERTALRRQNYSFTKQ